MAVELWCRMSSLSNANRNRWRWEAEWIKSRGFTGVRVDLAMSAEISVLPYEPDFDNLNLFLDQVIANDLKLQLQVGGDGPNVNSNWWTLMGLSAAWDYEKRPLKGDIGDPSDLTVVRATAAIKEMAIQVMVNRFRAAGRDPYEYCVAELGNEPSRGGAGAPSDASGYWVGYPTDDDYGTWDGTLFDPGGSGDYTTFLEYFNEEFPLIDTQDLRVVFPSFTSRVVSQSINSIQREIDTFSASDYLNWADVFNSDERTSFGISCYNNMGDAIIALGPQRVAECMVLGRDLKGENTSDPNGIMGRLKTLRAYTTNPVVRRITICEAGINPTMMAMDPTGAANRKPRLNYYELGRARLVYLDMLRELDVERVIFFTATDSDDSSVVANQYGAFSDQLGTANNQTYSAEIPFGQRVGARVSQPFAGPDYITAPNEQPPGI